MKYPSDMSNSQEENIIGYVTWRRKLLLRLQYMWDHVARETVYRIRPASRSYHIYNVRRLEAINSIKRTLHRSSLSLSFTHTHTYTHTHTREDTHLKTDENWTGFWELLSPLSQSHQAMMFSENSVPYVPRSTNCLPPNMWGWATKWCFHHTVLTWRGIKSEFRTTHTKNWFVRPEQQQLPFINK